MNEIEVKARAGDLDKLAKKLGELGCEISSPIIQEDWIYTPDGISLSEVRNKKVVVLRIRDENNGERIVFTLKKNRSNELDCIEKEVEIKDKKQLPDILKLLGYQFVAKIHKKRRKTKYNGCKICLDDVDQLGIFIEVEKMSSEPAGKIQAELFDFLKTLGIKEKDQVFKGYDTLLLEK